MLPWVDGTVQFGEQYDPYKDAPTVRWASRATVVGEVLVADRTTCQPKKAWSEYDTLGKVTLRLAHRSAPYAHCWVAVPDCGTGAALAPGTIPPTTRVNMSAAVTIARGPKVRLRPCIAPGSPGRM
jgi:hypothetical protein